MEIFGGVFLYFKSLQMTYRKLTQQTGFKFDIEFFDFYSFNQKTFCFFEQLANRPAPPAFCSPFGQFKDEQTVCSPHINKPIVPIFYLISFLIRLQTFLLAAEQPKVSKTVIRIEIGHCEVGQKIGRTHVFHEGEQTVCSG